MKERKLLYVDDDESQRIAIKKMLTLSGYFVSIHDNPEDVLAAVAKEYFPLIITDLEMPQMDGIQLCRLIRKIRPESVIYALSGHVAEFETEKLETAGFDGYLCKPVNAGKFEKAIEGAFDRIERCSKA